ncbi:MAG: Cof-type HAD-IIB family hydrolase [Treponema sp.]|nr:Cof-type HAD-IIB family hydrolase [Treponema sp.]
MSFSIDPKCIKAIALDLDGTILPHGALLSKRTIAAVKTCIKKGIKVIIATGRSLESAEPYRLSLGAEGPMVYLNGAMVVEMPQSKVLSSIPLDTGAAEFCVDLAREAGIYCQVYFLAGAGSAQTILMAEMDYPERNEYYEHTKVLAEIGDIKKAMLRPNFAGCIKIMFLAEPEILSTIRPRLEERLGKTVYIAKTSETFLEVMNAGASKGRGLKTIMELYGFKPEEVIAIGDEENDLPMFDVAGFSAAPAGAKDVVRQKVDLILGACSEDGVAIFLENVYRRRDVRKI